jgi:hypothetical protein
LYSWNKLTTNLTGWEYNDKVNFTKYLSKID